MACRNETNTQLTGVRDSPAVPWVLPGHLSLCQANAARAPTYMGRTDSHPKQRGCCVWP